MARMIEPLSIVRDGDQYFVVWIRVSTRTEDYYVCLSFQHTQSHLPYSPSVRILCDILSRPYQTHPSYFVTQIRQLQPVPANPLINSQTRTPTPKPRQGGPPLASFEDDKEDRASFLFSLSAKRSSASIPSPLRCFKTKSRALSRSTAAFILA